MSSFTRSRGADTVFDTTAATPAKQKLSAALSFDDGAAELLELSDTRVVALILTFPPTLFAFTSTRLMSLLAPTATFTRFLFWIAPTDATAAVSEITSAADSSFSINEEGATERLRLTLEDKPLISAAAAGRSLSSCDERRIKGE